VAKTIGKIGNIVSKLLAKGKIRLCTFVWANLVLKLWFSASVTSFIQTAINNAVGSSNAQWKKRLVCPPFQCPFPTIEKNGRNTPPSYPLRGDRRHLIYVFLSSSLNMRYVFYYLVLWSWDMQWLSICNGCGRAYGLWWEEKLKSVLTCICTFHQKRLKTVMYRCCAVQDPPANGG